MNLDPKIEQLLDDFIEKHRFETEKLRDSSDSSDRFDRFDSSDSSEMRIRFQIIEQHYPGRFDTNIKELNSDDIILKYKQIISDINKYNYTYNDIKKLSNAIVINKGFGLGNYEMESEIIKNNIPEQYITIITNIDKIRETNNNNDNNKYNKFFDFLTKSCVMAINDNRIDHDIKDNIKKTYLLQASMLNMIGKIECNIL